MIIKQKFISRDDLRNNPTIGYLFGDNLLQIGMGGQAKEMRGEPNAIGIPTKRSPEMKETAFFTDREYHDNIKAINKALEKCKNYRILIIPSDGLGTGLARLEEKAPRTFKYLQDRLNALI